MDERSSDELAGEPILLNMKAMQKVVGPEFDEDSAAIARWLRDGAEPAFEQIAVRLVAIHEELARRGWYEADDDVRRAIDAVRRCLAEQDLAGLRGAVARLVEMTRSILRRPPPQPPGKGGPKAAQLSLGKKG